MKRWRLTLPDLHIRVDCCAESRMMFMEWARRLPEGASESGKRGALSSLQILNSNDETGL